jgi:hypothetical protein
MEQLGIALAGILAGAFATEGLRAWRGRVETTRRLQGAKRLVAYELMMNAAMLAEEEATPEVLRRRLESGSISLSKWEANEALLAESLPDEMWSKIAAANLVLARMMSEAEGTSDSQLKALAETIEKEIRAAVPLLKPRSRSRQGRRRA